MNSLMSRLMDNGVEAGQKFNISEDSYRAAKSPFQRLILRLRQYIVYPLHLSFHLFLKAIAGKSRVPVIVSTNTFFAPFLAIFLINKLFIWFTIYFLKQ